MLSEGESGTNFSSNPYCVKKIGIKNVENILYKIINWGYLNNTSTFADLRSETIAMAAALYGNESPEMAQILEAWYAVGIGSAPITTMPYILVGNRTDVTSTNYHFNNIVLHQNYTASGGNINITSSKEVNTINTTDIYGVVYNAYIGLSCSGIGARLSNFNEEAAFIEPAMERSKPNISEENNYDFIIMPNPSTGHFRIQLNNSAEHPKTVTVIDLLGNVIYQNKDISTYELPINLTEAVDGVYIVQVGYLRKMVTEKLIKN